MTRDKPVAFLFILILFFFKIGTAVAQAPNISYSTPQTYTINTAITPLTPTNTGGAVPATVYGLVSTFAGSGARGSANGTGISASFDGPEFLTVDASGNVYVGDSGGYLVRKITPPGIVTTLAGSGIQGSANGQGAAASFFDLGGIAVDASGNLYVADGGGIGGSNLIRKITPGGLVSTFAGNGTAGSVDGPALSASFNDPMGLAFDAAGNLYVADMGGNVIRKIDKTGQVSTFAGLAGTAGTTDGTGSAALFTGPECLTIDATGNIYITEFTNNGLMRKITPAGVVTTFADNGTLGNAAIFQNPYGVSVDASGNLYIVDGNNYAIRELTAAGTETTLAGGGVGAVNGPGNVATFHQPFDLAVDGLGNLYVTDQDNNLIRKISLTGYTIDKPLPPGLTFDPTTGIITGTPTATSPAANYTVTAYNGSGSSSTIITISVNSVSPTITAGTATGTISACVGTASPNPQIQQFTVSGSNLTGTITATAPAGFEVSLAAGSGYGNSVTIPQTGGTASGTVVYVRSAASDPAGPVSGNVNLTSSGATAQTVAVAGIVNALPVANPVANQTYTAGTLTTGVTFTGAANTFTWTNDTPGVGLAASGTGNIAPFTAVNTGTAPVVATITATPETAGYLYIPYGATSVAIINNITDAVVSTITVGQSPNGISVSPDGSKVYVANLNGNTVSVISTSTNTVTATITVGTQPLGVAVSPDGSRVYVANFVDGTVSVINTTTNAVLSTITVGQSPSGVVVSPDGSKVYVTNAGSGTVSVINAATNAVTATIVAGASPKGISISPDGSRAYVANGNSGTVSVINTATNAVVATITAGNQPWGVAVSADGSTVYVSNHVSNTVSVINASTNKVTNTINVGLQPVGVSISADDTRVYVANVADGTVSVIETAANSVIATIPVGSFPQPFGNFVLSGTGCSGTPVQFTITVDPTSATPPTITASTATGTISACAGTASASPQVQQFTVSGSNLAGNITATAPVGFEVSLSAGSGYGPNVMLAQTGGIVNSTTIYVRSSATASTGNISGNVVLTSTTTTQIVAVAGTVNALPTVSTVPNQTVNNGAATAAIDFAGTGNTFTWVNDTPGVGLAASGSGNIVPFTAINTSSSPVTATITATPVSASFAYIANSGVNNVSVINTQSNLVVATVPVGSQPDGIAVNPVSNYVYVSNAGDNSISVINPQNNTVVSTIQVTGMTPRGLTVSPDGSRLYVVNEISGTVTVINTQTNLAVATISVGISPYGVCISPDGLKVYVTNQGSNNISVISTATNTVTSTIGVTGPYAIAITHSGAVLCVTDVQGLTVTLINTATNSIVSIVNVGDGPSGLAISPNDMYAYVVVQYSDDISIIDLKTQSIVGTISVPVSNSLFGISITSDGTEIYVTDQGLKAVSVISTSSNNVTETINVGLGPLSFGDFISNGTNCTGQPTQFTITVNPTPATVPNITSTAATGNNTACQGTASASPDIQQVLVSGTNLTGAISLTAPNGFEISLSTTTGFGTGLTLTPAGGTVANVPVYVRLAATAAVGSNSGNIEGTSPGAKTIEIPVTGTVNALPTVNTVPPQTVNNGTLTTAVNFTGTGNTFTWTNDTPGIGLPASGTGNIAAFTAVNTGSSPVKATITVEPSSSSYAYFPDPYLNSVAVISTQTNTVIGAIAVGGGPGPIAVNSAGTRVYVANVESNSVSVIDAATNTVIATVPVGSYPYGIVVSPDGNVLYVANQESQTISVINTATNLVTSTINSGSSPWSITISPDGLNLYATNYLTNTVSVINTSTKAITTIPVGMNPIGIAISPDGKYVYAANFGSNTISVINTATNAVVATVAVGAAPMGVSVTPDGSQIYISNSGSTNVSVIDAATNTVSTTIAVGANPEGISVSPSADWVYVSNSNGNSVSVINTATNTVTLTIPASTGQYAIGGFVTKGTNCTGPPIQFTITVNPSPAQTSGIIVGQVSGSITACQGNPSVSPDIAHFTVSGASLTAPIVLSAPNNFEISLSPGSGYTNTITLPLAGSSVNNTTIYVGSASTAPAGSNSGNVSLSSNGVQPKKVPVTSTVSQPPAVNPIPPQTFLNGATTTAINITGTGNSYNWSNNTPGIGLPASGIGSVPSFTAVNNGASPITATITVTPSSSGFAYIANYGSNTVSVVNTGDNTVSPGVIVGTNPWGVAVSPNGSKVYVTNQGSNTVSVIDAATQSVSATINVGLSPEGVVVTPDGSTVYVANNEGTTLSVISTATNAVTSVITVGSAPQGLAISPDGTRLYVANALSNTVSVINTTNNAVVATVNVGISPFGVAVSPDGGTVYVTNLSSGTVSVISTATNTLTATIVVGTNPSAVCVSPDGAEVYVSNGNADDISVINTTNNTVTTINLGSTPDGLSTSSDGTLLYVNDFTSSSVSVINTLTGNLVATIPVGQFPDSVGNFIWQGSGCPGVPATFTITIDPTPSTSPTIVLGTASGSISACVGTASVSPQLEQFIVAGSKLTGSITATAPPGFEVSLSAGSGFGNTVAIAEAAGNINNTVVYVRSSASASPGPVLGTVVLNSPGAISQDVAVTGIVNYLPAINPVAGQVTANGLPTTAVNFTGTGNVFSWTNDTPSIGLAANGSGNIASFTAINPGNSPVIATVTVTPDNTTTGCTGEPVTFTITVGPTPPTAVTATGVLNPLTTQYGTPSSSDTISVSGTSLTSGILVTPPVGFEISTDNVNFSSTLTIGSSGNVSASAVYIRLAATTPVGPYSGNIQISSGGAADFYMAMPLSSVTPALLAIIADDKIKTFGAVNPPLTATYVGFVNFETPAVLTAAALLSTTATTASPVGQYPINVSGATSPNYTINFINGTLTVEPTEQSIVIPNTFTPNGDGINDTWDIKFLNFYVNCSVDIFTRWGQKVYSSIGYPVPWDGTYKGSALPVGTYYYIINLKNGLTPLSGFVVIIH